MARRKIEPPKMGNVVKKIYDESGRYLGCICDDYCRDKTPEEVQAILDRCGQIWGEAMEMERLRKLREERESGKEIV